MKFDNIPIDKKRKLEKLAKIVQGGNLAILDHLLEIEDMIIEVKKEVPALHKAFEKIRGEPGYTPQKGKDYNDGYTPKKGVDYRDGENYILTVKDKADIVKSIKIPVVEKIIEKQKETIIKEIPIVKETIIKEPLTLKFTPQELRDLLELLQDDERIDAKYIKGLEELCRKINPPNGPMLHPVGLGNLPDVNVVGVTTGQSIVWNGVYWQNSNSVQVSSISGVLDPTAQGFTIAYIPDTQHMVSQVDNGTHAMFDSIIAWILANRVSQNIIAVVLEGDVTESAQATDFQYALTAYKSIIAAGIPVVPGIGNHDYDDQTNHVATTYNNYFGPSGIGNWNQYSWYNAGNIGQNCYVKVTVGTHKLLFLSVQWFPTTADITWAKGICAANPDYEIYVMTHGYMKNDGMLSEQNDVWGPGQYGITGGAGQDVRDQLISQYPNIKLCTGGHFITPTGTSVPAAAHTPDTGIYGNIFYNIFCNYQEVVGGNGFIMLWNIKPSTGELAVSNYSPFLGTTDTGFNAPYVLSYNPPIIPTGLPAFFGSFLRYLTSLGVTTLSLGNNGFMRFNNLSHTDDDGRASDVYMDSNGDTVIDATKNLILNADRTTGFVRLPVLTTTQRNALTGMTGGEIVYDSTIGGPYVYASGSWYAMQLAP